MEKYAAAGNSYPSSSIYPGMFTGANQTEDTIPDAEEQKVIAAVDTPAPPAVDGKQKSNMLVLFLLLLVLVFLFGGKG